MRGGRLDRRPGGRGLSIVEVMVALVVVAIGLFGIIDLMMLNQRYSVRAERRAVGAELAAAKLAEIQVAGYNALAALVPALSDSPTSPSYYPPAPVRFEEPYDASRFLWQASVFRAAAPQDALNVEVRVFWYPTAKAPKSTILEHSIALGALVVKEGGQ